MAKLRGISTLIFVLLGAASKPTQAQSLACGVDCATQTYRSCNDRLNLTAGPLVLSCSASLGSCDGEVFCASLGHGLPAGAFPLEIDEILLVASDGAATAPGQPFDLQVYAELGTAAPGPQLGSTYNLSIPGSNTRATRIDLSAAGFAPIPVANPGPFRVCLRKRFDGGHNVCLDPGQSTAGRNWVNVDIGVDCSSTLGMPAWYAAGNPIFPNIQGDFIFRARVRPSSFAAVPGAEDCGGSDAGVPDLPGASDAGPTPDGSELDAAAPTDGGDLGEPDGGPASKADAGMSSLPPPQITEVSPSMAEPEAAFDLVVSGSGFRSGATVQVGPRRVEAVSLFGASTLRGRVDPGLPEGAHDVLVSNPDGQVAIAPDAVLVGSGGPAVPAPPSTDCRCMAGTPSRRTEAALMGWVLLGLPLARRRHRRLRSGTPSAR